MTTKKLKSLLPLIPSDDRQLTELLNQTTLAQTTREEAIALRDQKRADALKAIEEKFGFDQLIENCERDLSTNKDLLEAWSVHNAARFGEKKSISFAGVTLGYRSNGWNTCLIGAKATWKAVVEKLRGLAELAFTERQQPEPNAEILEVGEIASSLIRVKVDPAKDVMLSNRENPEILKVLDVVGVGFEEKENFYIRPDREGQEGPEL